LPCLKCVSAAIIPLYLCEVCCNCRWNRWLASCDRLQTLHNHLVNLVSCLCVVSMGLHDSAGVWRARLEIRHKNLRRKKKCWTGTCLMTARCRERYLFLPLYADAWSLKNSIPCRKKKKEKKNNPSVGLSSTCSENLC